MPTVIFPPLLNRASMSSESLSLIMLSRNVAKVKCRVTPAPGNNGAHPNVIKRNAINYILNRLSQFHLCFKASEVSCQIVAVAPIMAPARGVSDLTACIKVHFTTSDLATSMLQFVVRGWVWFSAVSLNRRLFVGTITTQVNGTMITVTNAADAYASQGRLVARLFMAK